LDARGDDDEDGDEGDAEGHQGNEGACVEVEHVQPPSWVGAGGFVSHARFDRGRAGTGFSLVSSKGSGGGGARARKIAAGAVFGRIASPAAMHDNSLRRRAE